MQPPEGKHPEGKEREVNRREGRKDTQTTAQHRRITQETLHLHPERVQEDVHHQVSTDAIG
jgi:hypothetical protein